MPEEREWPDLLTVKETAEYLRIPRPTVYYLVKKQQLPAFQIGGRWRVDRLELDRTVLKKDRNRTRIMAVDDDLGIQKIMGQFLKKTGFDPTIVGDGQSALEEAGKNKFDLICVDLQLPDISGDILYLKLKEIQPTTPIIIVTGYPDSELLTRLLASGSVTILKKPVDWEQLRQTIEILSGGR